MDELLHIGIYWKSVDTKQTIPNILDHTHQHKIASSNCMMHRMLTLPISFRGTVKETNKF